MATIFDYINWRGDLTFRENTFNEVDNVIFSMLAYVDYSDLIAQGAGEKTALAEAGAQYAALHDPREEQNMPAAKRTGIDVLRAAAQTERFKNIGVSDYLSISSKETTAQMAVVTFWLSEHLAYVAYRGTDGTIVGWKEDFLLGSIPQTQGQSHAVQYLNERFGDADADLIVGGHSKGGNFAVYASAFCREVVKNRILRVYSNDGPGFQDDVTGQAAFQEILPRVTHIIPEGSMIGVIMDNQVEPQIVKSSAVGLAQHSAATWDVMGKAFVRGEKSQGTQVVQDGVNRMIRDMDQEERVRFTDTVFNALQATGAQTLRDLVSVPTLRGVLDNLGSLTRQQGEAVIRAIGRLAAGGEKDDEQDRDAIGDGTEQ